MTSVADVARELALADHDVLDACAELDIVASSSASGLSSTEHRRLRDHFGADDALLGAVPRGSTERDPHAAAEAGVEPVEHHHTVVDTWAEIRDEQRMWKFFGRRRNSGPKTNMRRLVRWSVAGFGLVAVGIAVFALNRDDPATAIVPVCVDFTVDGATTAVDCAEPHDAEVVARFSVDDDPTAAHPGSDALLAVAAARCPDPGDLGDAATALRAVYLVPTASTWADGDRAVLCLVEDPAAPLVGPVAAG